MATPLNPVKGVPKIVKLKEIGKNLVFNLHNKTNLLLYHKQNLQEIGKVFKVT